MHTEFISSDEHYVVDSSWAFASWCRLTRATSKREALADLREFNSSIAFNDCSVENLADWSDLPVEFPLLMKSNVGVPSSGAALAAWCGCINVRSSTFLSSTAAVASLEACIVDADLLGPTGFWSASSRILTNSSRSFLALQPVYLICPYWMDRTDTVVEDMLPK